jgi:1,4-alpha-glucan branching enzyme
MNRTSQNADAKWVRFEMIAPPGSRVYVAGTFNGWRPHRHRLVAVDGGDRYTAEVAVPPGTHEYKFIVNGVWVVDPGNPHWVVNPFGSLNSVLDCGT